MLRPQASRLQLTPVFRMSYRLLEEIPNAALLLAGLGYETAEIAI